jgi:hypothetical protein
MEDDSGAAGASTVDHQGEGLMRGAGMIAVAVTGWLTMVGVAHAQVFTPTYMAPRSGADLGIYLSDGPGDFAVEGILRRGFGGYDLGLRLGLADTDDLTLLISGELRNPIATGAPLDLAITGHAQGAFGDRRGAGFLLGLSLGHTFGTPGLSFTPYLHPRFGLVHPLRRNGGDFELDLLADFGFDVRISPSLDLRFGIGFGNPGAAWGVGFAWR